MDMGEGRSFFGVFDGHGGTHVAKFVEKYYCNYLVASEEFK